MQGPMRSAGGSGRGSRRYAPGSARAKPARQALSARGWLLRFAARTPISSRGSSTYAATPPRAQRSWAIHT
jgi:hypothetical protein